jgi:transcriptional regulator with XRE-family HTH domain
MNRLDRYIARQMKDPAFRKQVEQEVAELEVGILIARLRQSLKMNQTELAARAGMNASKISRIESSPKNVTLNTLTRVAQALNRRVKITFVRAERKVVLAHKRNGGLRKIKAKPSGGREE